MQITLGLVLMWTEKAAAPMFEPSSQLGTCCASGLRPPNCAAGACGGSIYSGASYTRPGSRGETPQPAVVAMTRTYSCSRYLGTTSWGVCLSPHCSLEQAIP